MLIVTAIVLFSLTLYCRYGLHRTGVVGRRGQRPLWRTCTIVLALALGWLITYATLRPLFPELGQEAAVDLVWPVGLMYMGAFSMVVALVELSFRGHRAAREIIRDEREATATR